MKNDDQTYMLEEGGNSNPTGYPIIIRIGEDQRWAADAQESGWLRRAWARNREDGKARWGAHGISRILRSELPGRLVTRAASGKEEEAVKKGGTDGGRESRRK